jgi:hypothetical protein
MPESTQARPRRVGGPRNFPVSLLVLAAIAALSIAGCGGAPPESPDVSTVDVTTTDATTTAATTSDTTTSATAGTTTTVPTPRTTKRVPAPRTPPVSTPRPAPKPKPRPAPPKPSCDPSYPTVCIPPAPPDLDCPQISARRFVVRPPDPHGFDNDNDGIGCESD